MARALLRIGTRGSPLALIQAAELAARLAGAYPELAEPGALETVIIRTTGDKVRDRTLAEIGGKGLFIKELEEALLAGAIDVAVHSLKDMTTVLPDSLEIACHLPREDPRDAFLSPRAASVAALPAGAVIGTASLRRQAQLLHARPDLRIVPLRGNVETRLAKLQSGVIDGTLLAVAGLKRSNQMACVTEVLPPELMLPAVAQGAIGAEARRDDERVGRWLAPLNDKQTAFAVTAERALLAMLDGSCRTPIAGLAELDAAGGLSLRGMVVRPDGGVRHLVSRAGLAADAAALGADAGAELKRRAGPDFFALPLPGGVPV